MSKSIQSVNSNTMMNMAMMMGMCERMHIFDCVRLYSGRWISFD